VRIRVEFKAQGLWVGAFWKSRIWECPPGVPYEKEIDLWICLLPMLPIHLTWSTPVDAGWDRNSCLACGSTDIGYVGKDGTLLCALPCKNSSEALS